MRTKFIALLALTLCMSAFLMPMTAYASTNDDRPTVTANIEGEVLQITATGGFIGVEAIFINSERFNFRVDGVLSVDLLAFRNSEEITIYAVDFAGTHSNVVTLSNPHYVGLATQTPPQGGIPVTSSNPFTPDGQASVTDNATSHDDKEFFTFTTPSGHVFFLVVDRQRGSDNVYFLNAVTEQDLIALAEQSDTEINTIGGSGGIPVSTTPQNPQEQEPADTEPVETEPPVADSGGGNGALIFLLVAVLIGGGAGYYIKIIRPKQQGNDYDDEDEDEEDIGEEMEFDTEQESSEDGEDEDYYNTDEDETKDKDVENE